MAACYRPFYSERNCPASKGIYICNGECPAVQTLQDALFDCYGHTEFPPGQLDAALAVLHDHVFSTVAGKSLCMLLPPLTVSSLCTGVVISPLNCLIDE